MSLIVKGIVRGGGRKYAHYLQNPKNEQVRVYQISGTANPHSLEDSLTEMSAYERFTRSHKGLYETIVNPSFDHPITAWDEVIASIAKHAGMEKQAYAAVIHTYQGKDHMHLVFSRYDHDTGKMLELPYSNLKLREATVEIEQKLGHEHLLNWKEKKSLQRERDLNEQQTIEDQQKREQTVKQQFSLNSDDVVKKKVDDEYDAMTQQYKKKQGWRH